MSHLLDKSKSKKLGEAILHWLEYQECCRRDKLLGEKLTTIPIADYLRAIHQYEIAHEWNHPGFATAERGRPKQIDFCVFSRDNRLPKAAIEVKWIKQKAITPQQIIDDLLRLECLVDTHTGMMNYFIIAGFKEGFDTKFERLLINSGNGRRAFLPLVLSRDNRNPLMKIQVSSAITPMARLFESFAIAYGKDLPKSFTTELICLESGHTFKVGIWRVLSSRNRKTFKHHTLNTK